MVHILRINTKKRLAKQQSLFIPLPMTVSCWHLFYPGKTEMIWIPVLPIEAVLSG